ncbi:hypothetical protein K144316041_23250 [Clostridium tetani]|uniref:phage tail protein n=1 Tax=Clostridium tetani TaxID=1513 RepID=UPI002953D257|nr:phage tail protein [Clostridium tetani]BDR73617.1 hypothetical protein K144316041_23250 [Clostridium tetani]
MAEQFYTILTAIGKAKIANATALGNKVNFTTLKIGDSNGKYYNPTESQEDLINAVWQGNINSISVDKKNPNWIVIEVIIPSNIGGFVIREAGIFDDEGDLIAVGKYPETYKPKAEDGSTKDLIIKMILEVSNTSTVTLKVDPTVILATKEDIEVLENKIENIKVPVTSVNSKTGEVVLKAEDISTSRNKTVEQELTGNRQVLLNLTNNKADQHDFELLQKQVKANLDLINAPSSITLYVDGVNGSNFGDNGLSEDKPLRSLGFAFDKISSFHRSVTINIIGDVTLTSDMYLNTKISRSNPINITTNNGSKIKSDGDRTMWIDNVSWIKLEQLNITGVNINARFNTAVFLKNCTFANNTSAVSSLYGSKIIVESCSFSGSTYACMAAKTCGKIHSSYNTGNSVKYGLAAYEGGVISKQGSQPTGSQTNEYTIQGGVIR